MYCVRRTICYRSVLLICRLFIPLAIVGANEQPKNDAHLPFEHTLPGTVSDKDGNPVAGASIEARRFLEEPLVINPNADGRFLLRIRPTRRKSPPLLIRSADGQLMSYVGQKLSSD